MSDIVRICPIDKEMLDERAYFPSLLQSALSFGLLDEKDAERIQGELLELLSRQIGRFNNGDSSSVRVETAQELSDSILYTVGAFLREKEIPDAVDMIIRQSAAKERFAESNLSRSICTIYFLKMLFCGIFRPTRRIRFCFGTTRGTKKRPPIFASRSFVRRFCPCCAKRIRFFFLFRPKTSSRLKRFFAAKAATSFIFIFRTPHRSFSTCFPATKRSCGI